LRDDLKLPDLFKNVNDLVAKLDDFYNKVYTVKTQIPPEEARIAGYLKEIDILTKQNTDNQNRITNDNLKLVQTNNLIRDIQTRLQDAKDLRDSLTASIAANTALINDNNTKIANIRISIDEVNAKIRALKDTLDGLNKAANTLEIDVQRARTDLSVAQAKDKVFADQIKDFQNQIAVQQPRLRDDDLLKLRTLISNLTLTLPQIQNQINREYYYCYGAGKVETVTTGTTIVYVIRGQAFG
jgi:chromosome segregation ATPase